MILEIRRRAFAVGLLTQRWPKARHFVVRLGGVESRLIVPNDVTLTPAALALAFVGLFLR